MPRITMTERDLSWYYRQRGSEGAATVYVPGIATFGPYDPVLCNSRNFTNIFGVKSVKGVKDISYDMAASFIKAGFNVLFQRVELTGSTPAYATAGEVSSEGALTTGVKFLAKYSGTFGNSIKLLLNNASASENDCTVDITVVVSGTSVEYHRYDFINPDSPYYYEKVNEASEYITTQVVGTGITGSIFSEESLLLSGGKDYQYSNIDNTNIAAVVEAIRQEVGNAIAQSEGMLEELKDPYQYDFDIAISAGWSQYTTSTEINEVDGALKDLVVSRGTSVFLVDGKPDWGAEDFYSYCGNFDSSYVAAYGPWGRAQLLNTGETQLLPGSYAVIVAWATTCSEGVPFWIVPAGVKRASLNDFYEDTKYFVGSRILDMWQNHQYLTSSQYSINPIMKVKQYGYTIYGNSTLLQSRGPKSKDQKTSALQQFSTRILANRIKSKAFEISLSLQFDQLVGDLFLQFKTLLGVFLDQLRYQKSLNDYEIVLTEGVLTSANLNERTIPITIRISPNPSVENFDLTLEISQYGVTFSGSSENI